MKPIPFPSLALSDWKATRDTLLKYCRLVGAIREALSSPLPHSLHTNLLLCGNGFTTTLIQKNPSSPEHNFEVIIDLIHNKLRIESNYREPLYVALTGQSLNALCDEACSLLTDIGISTSLEKPSFIDGRRGQFDEEPLKYYWQATKVAAILFNKIKEALDGETSPVQLRPDDLSLNLGWFGNKIFANKNLLIEQVEFGFSTGDDIVPEMYFYVSAFPESEILEQFYDKSSINQSNRNFKKAVLPLKKLLSFNSPEEKILSFFQSFSLVFKQPE